MRRKRRKNPQGFLDSLADIDPIVVAAAVLGTAYLLSGAASSVTSALTAGSDSSGDGSSGDGGGGSPVQQAEGVGESVLGGLALGFLGLLAYGAFFL